MGHFFQWLRGRGLDGVKLIVGDKCMGMQEAVAAELHTMKLKETAKKVEDGIEETLTYCDFPSEHWTHIRANNVIERLNREMRRRTHVMGTFPGRNSALCWAVPGSATWRAPSEATRNTWIRSTWRRLWTTPSLPADFIQQEPAKQILRINLDGTMAKQAPRR